MFFSKLSNKLRVDIVSSLEEKEKSVGDLSNELKIEQSKLSHALRELKECNIVQVKKKGKQRIYSLSKSIIPILRMIKGYSKNHCAKCNGCS